MAPDAFNGPLTPEPSAPAPSSYPLPGGAGSPSSSYSGGSPSRAPSSGPGSSAGGQPGGSDLAAAQRKRFGNGLGRKIRTALADFLSNR